MEAGSDQYFALDEDSETDEPAIFRDTFPACKEGEELNIADVMVTCNFLFRDA